MANSSNLPSDPNRLNTPTDDSVRLSGELEEQGVFASLVQSFRDVFFPD